MAGAHLTTVTNPELLYCQYCEMNYCMHHIFLLNGRTQHHFSEHFTAHMPLNDSSYYLVVMAVYLGHFLKSV
jgi:hypothetical protein